MQLYPETANAVLAEYFNCDDGVVKDVRIECGTSRSDRVCTVVAECMKEGATPSEWVRAHFRVTGVTEFRFQLVKTTFEVLSSGVQVIWKDGLVYLVLDAYPDDGPGLPDLATNIAYVAGSECHLEITSLRARDSEP